MVSCPSRFSLDLSHCAKPNLPGTKMVSRKLWRKRISPPDVIRRLVVRGAETEVPVGHRVPEFRLRATFDARAPVFRPPCGGPRSFCFRVRFRSQSRDLLSQVASRVLCSVPEVSKQGRALLRQPPEPGLAAPGLRFERHVSWPTPRLRVTLCPVSFRCHAEGLRLSTRLIQKQVHAH